MTRKATQKATLTIHELLKNDLYKAWLKKIPKVNAGHSDPWTVFVLSDGRWSKRTFPRYTQAYNFMVRNLKEYDDIVIHSNRVSFKPPVVKYKGKKQYWPSPRGFRWCPYCRRPTRFAYFRKHRNHKMVEPYVKRCSVCGIRGENIPVYDTNIPHTLSAEPTFVTP